MDSSNKKGLNAWQRTWTAMKRSRYLLLLAFGFRIQMWAFSGGWSPWTDIFKVDILNAMGLGIIALAPMAIFDTKDRVRFGAISGVVIAALAPIVSTLPLSGIHPFVRAWFEPNSNYFAFFPWAAFIAFGLSAGSVLRLVDDADMHKVMQWAAIFGFVLLFGAQYFSNLPYSVYPVVDFWLNSPSLIFMKVGIILLLASFAFLWTRHMNPNGWSFVRQLGTTSLLVYWVHTELVYGRWFGPWKESLSVAQTVAMAVGVIVAMIGLSVARTGYKGGASFPVWARERWAAWRTVPADQVTGD